MRYRVRYNISAARIIDNSSDKRTTSTKVSGRVVVLPNINEAPGNQKAHKAIRDVLTATHAKHEHLDKKHIAVELVSVIRLVAPKRLDFVRDHWIAEPVEKSMEAMPADENAKFPHRDDEKTDNASESLEDEEDDWDDMEEDVVPPKPAVNIKRPKPVKKKKKTKNS